MLVPEIFRHLHRCNPHARLLQPVLIPAAEENIFIIKAVLVLLPHKPCLPWEVQKPFAAQGNAVSNPAQIPVNIVIAMVFSRLRNWPGGTNLIVLKKFIPPLFRVNHKPVIVNQKYIIRLNIVSKLVGNLVIKAVNIRQF